MSDISDDKTLRALGKLAREQQEAASPELEELLRPLSAEAKEKMAQRAMPALGLPSSGATNVLVPARGWRRATRLTAVAVPLALAASLFFVLVLRGPSSSAIPSYEAAWSGGVQALRADPAAPVERLGPNAQLQLLLRPAKTVEGNVAVRLFAIEGGAAREWKIRSEVSPEGAIRVVALGSDLGTVTASELEVVAVVGRPNALPAANELGATREGLQVFRRKIQWH